MEVLVLVDFEGQPGDELKITAGDIIQKVQPGPEEGWLQGELDGRVGLFPKQFVQEIPANLRADGTQRYPRSLRGAHAGKKLPTMKPQRWCRVTFSYTPSKEDELELCPGELVQILEEIEDGWWLGKKNGQLGAFPSNFVEELSSLPSDLILTESKVGVAKQRPKLTDNTFLLGGSEEMDNVAEMPAPQVQVNSKVQVPQTGSTPVYCQVMFDYEPEHEDELQLKKGDKILLLSKETADMGWWEGESRGKRGLFPDNFVMPLTPVEPEIKSKVPARKKESLPKPGKKVLQSSKVEMKPPGEHRDPKEQRKTDPPKLNPPPVKKPPPPPPPVPAKAKSLASPFPKSSGLPVSCTATPGRKGKGKDTPDGNTFDALLVPGTRLSHPTASRPKVPGKRPPSQLMLSLVDEVEATEPSKPTNKMKSPEPVKESLEPTRSEPPATASKTTQQEEQPAFLEDLRTELRTLRTLMDMMRVQHQKDMEELKAEMCHEQSKRAALQAEIERLKQAVAAPESQNQVSKHSSPGTGATEPVEPGALSTLPNPHAPGCSKD